MRAMKLPVGDERIGLDWSFGERHLREIEDPNEDVIYVTSRLRALATERVWLCLGSLPAAPPAHKCACETCHSGLETPVRLFVSVMSASQTEIRSRRPRQKLCLWRRWKSSKETPCCSTHVK